MAVPSNKNRRDAAPSHFGGHDDNPAEEVSWIDAAKYANALSIAEGLTACYTTDGLGLTSDYVVDPYSCGGYRLPTEAEWEYAARAGQDTIYSGSDVVEEVAWFIDNSGLTTRTVCTRVPNAWGLCDMTGNVYEWVDDWYEHAYGGYGTGAAESDPPGSLYGSQRVKRGGYWGESAGGLVVAQRGVDDAALRNSDNGFRIARTIPE